jgi:hypothetical protein
LSRRTDRYRIFVSEDGDWYVVGRRDGDAIEVLYQGHHYELALEAILVDLEDDRPGCITVNMSSGSYEPRLEDWNR